MKSRLLKVLAPMAGLAFVAMPGVVVATVPATTQCAGGICDICPAVAQVLTTTGAQIYCIA